MLIRIYLGGIIQPAIAFWPLADVMLQCTRPLSEPKRTCLAFSPRVGTFTKLLIYGRLLWVTLDCS